MASDRGLSPKPPRTLVPLVAPTSYATACTFFACFVLPSKDLEFASHEIHLESFEWWLESSGDPSDGVARRQRACRRRKVADGVELRDLLPICTIRFAVRVGCLGRRTPRLSFLIGHEFLRDSTRVNEPSAFLLARSLTPELC